ncbi:DUF3558 domain-containing protein [Streptomyces sp. SID6673]|nr:DUF3558 domain-containing protein [Streptomyces sp. SID11726]NDZ94872.1 DUF3558 domain-containing protein [Streptomyces sp. SID11726]NEB23032.1 DUF3558 domain-containing protein [Streptomyces sp. SID6673]
MPARYALTLGIVACLIACGCGPTQQGTPVSESSKSNTDEPRQLDDVGKELPFHNQFPQRWNSSNDGTSYEPCTAVNTVELNSLGIDPMSVADAATVDGQTLRGCEWSRRPPAEKEWSVAQLVANSRSLQAYKEKYRTNTWRPDVSMSGRNVGIMLDSGDSCWTYVQSGRAGVLTQASYFSLPRKPYSELCDVAIEFTRATIDKIPK